MAVWKGTGRKPLEAGRVVCMHLGLSRAGPRRVWRGRGMEGPPGMHTLPSCLFPFPRVPYLAVARTFEKIEEVSAR